MFSGSEYRRVCQWVFLSAMPPPDQQQQRRGHRTVPDIVEEVHTHTEATSQAFIILSHSKSQSGSRLWGATCEGFLNQSCQTFNCDWSVDRRSSSTDSPLIQTTVTLPHVMLESVPLYIHAGQYSTAFVVLFLLLTMTVMRFRKVFCFIICCLNWAPPSVTTYTFDVWDVFSEFWFYFH